MSVSLNRTIRVYVFVEDFGGRSVRSPGARKTLTQTIRDVTLFYMAIVGSATSRRIKLLLCCESLCDDVNEQRNVGKKKRKKDEIRSKRTTSRRGFKSSSAHRFRSNWSRKKAHLIRKIRSRYSSV